jgi:hypothetical protein
MPALREPGSPFEAEQADRHRYAANTTLASRAFVGSVGNVHLRESRPVPDLLLRRFLEAWWCRAETTGYRQAARRRSIAVR